MWEYGICLWHEQIPHNPTLQGASACQTTVCKPFSDQETIDMKAVVNDYERSYEIIFPGNCDMLDVNNDCTTVVQMSLQ